MFVMFILLGFAFSEVSDLPDQPIVWKVYQSEGRIGRTLFETDPILLSVVENADFVPDWQEEARADENGNVRHQFLRNGWAYTEYESDKRQTVLLEGTGFHSLFVNGERFAGDYYSHGFVRIPVPLKEGKNHFLVRAVRSGQIKVNLLPSSGSCSISPHDIILPDMREDKLIDSFGAVVILNHTDQILEDAELDVGDSRVFELIREPLPAILPYSISKPAFRLKQLRQPEGEEIGEGGTYKLTLVLRQGETKQAIDLTIPIRKVGQPYKETKISGIDSSVQYYGVRPPIDFDPDKSYALYFTLHGAAVEATGQIGAYSSKRDGFIVAPTNRRPYGFDWQEWGRLDAMETLDLFTRKHNIDPQRIYLTGHSMGGHGTWYLGALYPDRFASIGPSAGWLSFSSYRRRSRGSDEESISSKPFEWAELESDTMSMVYNYTDLPIYAIHGEKDDNVPVRESRRMVEELEKFHKDFIYHEQPGAGHWWDDGSTPGAECVDWLPLFDFFCRHVKPKQPLSIKFKTPNPAISASFAWVTIQSQTHPSSFSSVIANADPRIGSVSISTDNVERLRLDLTELLPQSDANIQIDSETISAPTSSPIHLMKAKDEGWKLTELPSSWSKSDLRNGPFKLAFDKKMVWVYGTNGTDEENIAILAKVRYDSQVWWYRSNGNVTIVSDSDFDPDDFADRNIILYGNSDTNSAFSLLPKNCPIKISRNSVKVGQETFDGDLGLFLVYPRQGSDENLIGVVGMASVKSARMNLQARYFISGVACPDYVIFSPEVLSKGTGGILKSGYFNNEWELDETRQ